LVQINPIGTSQTCSHCGHRDQKARHGKRFQCAKAGCGYEADADANAAENIGDRGSYYYLKRYGVTLDDVREQRLCPPLPCAE
jgi:ribosomal protein S27AE